MNTGRLVAFSILSTLAFCGFCLARKPANHCLSITEASNYAGSDRCVAGTVTRVETGEQGATFLTFCKDAKACSFTAVVFPADIKKMGELRELEGRQVEIKGMIQQHDGHAQIVLRHSQQLGESAYVVIPRVPTEYDVEKAGHGRAGSIRKAKTQKTKTKRQGAPVSLVDPNEP